MYDNQLRTVAEQLMATEPVPCLPDDRAAAAIVDDLRRLLFPACFGGGDTLSLLEELEGELTRQIALTLPDGDAGATAREFLLALPRIRQMLWEDVDALFAGDPAARSRREIILAYPGLYAVLVYRAAHELHRLGVPLLPRILSEYAHSRTGIDIHPGAEIGPRFFIDHGTGVVVGETTVIGADVKLYQGVTLGALSPRSGRAGTSGKRHPTVCDGVTVYSGATILGGDTVIGAGAVVGGNAFVTRSVPPGARVSACPIQ